MTSIRIVTALLTAAIFVFSSDARAGSGAFAVDAADVGDAGSCKVESWVSTARNADFSAVVYPTCVFFPTNPTQFGLMANTARGSGDWSTTLMPRFKTAVIPTSIGRFGFSAEGGAGFDALSGENTSIFFNVPATLRLSEVMRISLNSGWLWDRVAEHHYFTYGASFDYKLTETLQFTAEVYGQSGATEFSSVRRPRVQSGLRWRPIDDFSIDLLYGHNINGEHSNWLTVGTTIRFPPPAK